MHTAIIGADLFVKIAYDYAERRSENYDIESNTSKYD